MKVCLNLVIKLIKLFFKVLRFFTGLSVTRLRIFFLKIQSSSFFNAKLLSLKKLFVKVQLFCHTVLIRIPAFYSDFARNYSVLFWFRLMMLILLYPIKIFFNSFFYPMLTTYFYSGVAFYIVLSTIFTLSYLALLWPGFAKTLRQGDIYVVCVLQMIYIEVSFSMPLNYYYVEPFLLDSLIMVARTYDLFGQPSKLNLPFDTRAYNTVKERYIQDEEIINVHDISLYSELKPTSNSLAPSQLYKVALDRSVQIYGFENRRFIEYFFKRHLPLLWKDRATAQIMMWKWYEFLDQVNPADRCLIWHSGMTPFSDFFERLGYQDKFRSQDWVRYCHKLKKVRFNERLFEYSMNHDIKNLPPYILDLFKVPRRPDDMLSESRRFERIVRSRLLSFADRVNSQHFFRVRTFFDTPGMESENDSNKGFYVYLRAQKKVGGIHLSPVLVPKNFYCDTPWAGSTIFHYLFPAYSDYARNKDLRILETWSTFYSERYPVSTAPLLELDRIFANSRCLGLIILFDFGGEKAFFNEREDWEPDSSIYFHGLPHYYSPLQRDFSPTYNLDILEFVKRLPGHENYNSLFFQFSPGSDFNPSDLVYPLDTDFSVSSFKVLTMYGHRGLIFNRFCKFNIYRKFIDSQWYIFTKEKMYDPLNGRLYWTLGTNVWSWGISQRWIRDSRLVSVYNNTFGIPGVRRVPYPTRFYIPLMRESSSIDLDTPIIRSIAKYSRAKFKFEQYYIPYQLDRWSEPPPTTPYEIVQNGHWIRQNEDPRLSPSSRHNPILSYMRFDRRCVENYLFLPRLFDSPFHRNYHYVLHRNFDQYDWPRYMNNEMRRFYPRSALKVQAYLLDDRPTWKIRPNYISPGFHPMVPRSLIHPWDRYDARTSFAVARGLSYFFERYDLLYQYFIDWPTATWFYYSNRFNYRYVSYYIYSQIIWGRLGGRYNNFDLWWNGYLNKEYGKQLVDIKGSLNHFRFTEYLAEFWGKPRMYRLEHQQRYFTWVANLLELYFNELGWKAPGRVADFSKSVLPLNTPVRPLPDKVSPAFAKPYPNFVPQVLFDLQEILDEDLKIMQRTGWYSSGPEHQKWIDHCMKKYPPEYLLKEVHVLISSKEKDDKGKY